MTTFEVPARDIAEDNTAITTAACTSSDGNLLTESSEPKQINSESSNNYVDPVESLATTDAAAPVSAGKEAEETLIPTASAPPPMENESLIHPEPQHISDQPVKPSSFSSSSSSLPQSINAANLPVNEDAGIMAVDQQKNVEPGVVEAEEEQGNLLTNDGSESADKGMEVANVTGEGEQKEERAGFGQEDKFQAPPTSEAATQAINKDIKSDVTLGQSPQEGHISSEHLSKPLEINSAEETFEPIANSGNEGVDLITTATSDTIRPRESLTLPTSSQIQEPTNISPGRPTRRMKSLQSSSTSMLNQQAGQSTVSKASRQRRPSTGANSAVLPYASVPNAMSPPTRQKSRMSSSSLNTGFSPRSTGPPPMDARPTAASPYLLTVLPPMHLPHDPPHPKANRNASGYGPPAKFRRGTLVPLYPTLSSQLGAIAREYGLPSTGGIVLYLVSTSDPSSGAPLPGSSGLAGENGPRIGEEAWNFLWARLFETAQGGFSENEESHDEYYVESGAYDHHEPPVPSIPPGHLSNLSRLKKSQLSVDESSGPYYDDEDEELDSRSMIERTGFSSDTNASSLDDSTLGTEVESGTSKASRDLPHNSRQRQQVQRRSLSTSRKSSGPVGVGLSLPTTAPGEQYQRPPRSRSISATSRYIQDTPRKSTVARPHNRPSSRAFSAGYNAGGHPSHRRGHDYLSTPRSVSMGSSAFSAYHPLSVAPFGSNVIVGRVEFDIDAGRGGRGARWYDNWLASASPNPAVAIGVNSPLVNSSSNGPSPYLAAQSNNSSNMWSGTPMMSEPSLVSSHRSPEWFGYVPTGVPAPVQPSSPSLFKSSTPRENVRSVDSDTLQRKMMFSTQQQSQQRQSQDSHLGLGIEHGSGTGGEMMSHSSSMASDIGGPQELFLPDILKNRQARDQRGDFGSQEDRDETGEVNQSSEQLGKGLGMMSLNEFDNSTKGQGNLTSPPPTTPPPTTPPTTITTSTARESSDGAPAIQRRDVASPTPPSAVSHSAHNSRSDPSVANLQSAEDEEGHAEQGAGELEEDAVDPGKSKDVAESKSDIEEEEGNISHTDKSIISKSSSSFDDDPIRRSAIVSHSQHASQSSSVGRGEVHNDMIEDYHKLDSGDEEMVQEYTPLAGDDKTVTSQQHKATVEKQGHSEEEDSDYDEELRTAGQNEYGSAGEKVDPLGDIFPDDQAAWREIKAGPAGVDDSTGSTEGLGIMGTQFPSIPVSRPAGVLEQRVVQHDTLDNPHPAVLPPHDDVAEVVNMLQSGKPWDKYDKVNLASPINLDSATFKPSVRPPSETQIAMRSVTGDEDRPVSLTDSPATAPRAPQRSGAVDWTTLTAGLPKLDSQTSLDETTRFSTVGLMENLDDLERALAELSPNLAKSVSAPSSPYIVEQQPTPAESPASAIGGEVVQRSVSPSLPTSSSTSPATNFVSTQPLSPLLGSRPAFKYSSPVNPAAAPIPNRGDYPPRKYSLPSEQFVSRPSLDNNLASISPTSPTSDSPLSYPPSYQPEPRQLLPSTMDARSVTRIPRSSSLSKGDGRFPKLDDLPPTPSLPDNPISPSVPARNQEELTSYTHNADFSRNGPAWSSGGQSLPPSIDGTIPPLPAKPNAISAESFDNSDPNGASVASADAPPPRSPGGALKGLLSGKWKSTVDNTVGDLNIPKPELPNEKKEEHDGSRSPLNSFFTKPAFKGLNGFFQKKASDDTVSPSPSPVVPVAEGSFSQASMNPAEVQATKQTMSNQQATVAPFASSARAIPGPQAVVVPIRQEASAENDRSSASRDTSFESPRPVPFPSVLSSLAPHSFDQQQLKPQSHSEPDEILITQGQTDGMTNSSQNGENGRIRPPLYPLQSSEYYQSASESLSRPAALYYVEPGHEATKEQIPPSSKSPIVPLTPTYLTQTSSGSLTSPSGIQDLTSPRSDYAPLTPYNHSFGASKSSASAPVTPAAWKSTPAAGGGVPSRFGRQRSKHRLSADIDNLLSQMNDIEFGGEGGQDGEIEAVDGSDENHSAIQHKVATPLLNKRPHDSNIPARDEDLTNLGNIFTGLVASPPLSPELSTAQLSNTGALKEIYHQQHV